MNRLATRLPSRCGIALFALFAGAATIAALSRSPGQANNLGNPRLLRQRSGSSVTECRRATLHGLGGTAAALLISSRQSKAEDGVSTGVIPSGIYKDEQEMFEIQFPKDWLMGKTDLTNGLGSSESYKRKVVGFVPVGARDKTNVNVVVSPVAIDFKNMGSFGSPESFGIKLVNLVDRKYGKNAKKNVATARLIDTFNVGDVYFAEYETFEDYSEEVGDYTTKLRFFVANAIRNPGRYNRLFSVTGVCDQQDVDKFYPQIVEMVKSFNPPRNAL